MRGRQSFGLMLFNRPFLLVRSDESLLARSDEGLRFQACNDSR